MATNMQSSGSGWLGPAISVAGSLIGSAASWASGSKLNKRAENYNKWMYAHQRRDALADWDMQNQYNSPAAQMQRFKDAGLNPNLMYGQGESGGASMVRSSSSSTPSYKMPDFSGIAQAGTGVLMNALQAKQLRANIQRTEAETSAVQTSTADKELSLRIRNAVGYDALVNRAMAENQHASVSQRKGVIEAEAFIEAALSGADWLWTDVRPGIGSTPGSYKGSVLSDSIKSVLAKNVKQLELLKQNVTNAGLDATIKGSISTIKKSEAEIYEVLKGTQMAGQAGQLLYAMLRLVLMK